MALQLAGKSSILNHIGTTFTHIAVGGTFTRIGQDLNPYETPFNLDGIAAPTPTIAAGGSPGTITWSGNTVFTVSLSSIHADATQVTIKYVRLVDSTNSSVYLERDFASSYVYAGNGTFTVTGILISLS